MGIIVSFLSNFMNLLPIAEENQKMLDYAIALTNIYGWVPYSQYVHIWNLYNENQITEDMAENFFEVMQKKEPEIWIHDKTVINEILLELKLDNPPSAFFELLEEFGYIFEDKQTVEEFMKIFQEISNNSRKWTLRGFTPTEIRQLFYN